MKKLIIIALVAISTAAFPYNNTFIFSGIGASSTVDSVIVQNITQKITLTVPAGNSLNLTDMPSAIEQLSATDETIRIYPNESDGKYTVQFNAKNDGNTQINAYSVDGRKVVSLTQQLSEGINSFQLSLPKGAYIIQVNGKGFNYVAKMISQTKTQSQAAIAFKANQKSAVKSPQKAKSDVGVTTMVC